MSRQGKWRKGRTVDILAVGLLALLTVAFYREIALTGKILAGVDAFTYFYPYRHYTAQMVCAGRLPLWNPYLFMGVPMFANPQAAVLYPLNLLLCWLDGPHLVTWSIVLHVAMAASFTYLYTRGSLHLSPPAALLAASAFAFGGFLSGMIEHINQLNVLAWFPLLLWFWDQRARWRRHAAIGAGTVIALGLLAGHSQSTYICLFGLTVYALAVNFIQTSSNIAKRLTALGYVALDLTLSGAIGLGLAAVQLLPTWELTHSSIRSGGLSYREAIAFSLKPLPRLLRYTLFPPLGANLGDQFGGDFFTEFVAYIGMVPLVVLIGWLGSWIARHAGKRPCTRPPNRSSIALLLLTGLGLFLAFGGYNPLYWVLYKLVPGFGLFRVPARWLFLYAFGAAVLSGIGLDHLTTGTSKPGRTFQRFLPPVALLLTWIELFIAAQAFPLAHPTAPEAFSSLRTAPAHIIAAQNLEALPGRVLSISDIMFDPGDQHEIEQIFADQLEPRAVYDLIVSSKRKEILAPNLPLAWHVYTVDGYDGGVLPLQRYVELQKLFLPPERRAPDGRLRENLERIPPSRLLSLLGVHYVLTDKVNDVWIDNVFYDLAFEAVLSQVKPEIDTTDLPDFQATALGIVAYVEGTMNQDTPIAEIRLETTDGEHIVPLYHHQVGQNADTRHATIVQWSKPQTIRRLRVIALASTLHIQGLTLIDRRDGSNIPVILSTDGRYRLVHSGDVKIYEVSDALPRAFVVGQATWAETDEQALAILADPTFDPAQQVVLSGIKKGPLTSGQVRAQVSVQHNAPEQVRLQVTSDAPGYLVLSDTDYPGWHATVDGQTVEIMRANLLFRAVHLDAGTHTVEFTYQPTTLHAGMLISLVSMVILLLFVGSKWGIGIARAAKKAATCVAAEERGEIR